MALAMALVSWMLALWLVVLALAVVVPVWKRAGTPSGPSRRSLLAGLLEVASIAGILRLISPWSSGSVILWVVAVVALAAAVAGAVLHWPELPGRTSKSEGAAGEAAGTEATEPAAEEPASDPTLPERPDQSRPVQSSAALSTTAEQTRWPSLPVREAPVVPIPGKPLIGKPRRKSKAGKKAKKEPGNLALAGQAALLVAVVVISFLGG